MMLSSSSSRKKNESMNKRQRQPPRWTTTTMTTQQCLTVALVVLVAFLLGCFLAASYTLHSITSSASSTTGDLLSSYLQQASSTTSTGRRNTSLQTTSAADSSSAAAQQSKQQQRQRQVQSSTTTTSSSSSSSVLDQLRVFVVLVAFDFSQLPHLEEVLDSYHDMCLALGSRSGDGGGDSNSNNDPKLDIVILATVPYPVTLIDLFNTRYSCPHWSLTIMLKPKSLKLHLVDCHRQLFYDRIDQYDLFIYSEDDIRVTTTTVVTYLEETKRVQELVQNSEQRKPSDFNVGIVRYEYNYPANIIIDDNTRHATQNVTRVYWEHSGFQRPDVVPNALEEVTQEPLKAEYLTMRNHHQGMYLATRDLLKAWQVRPKCDFSNARNRPGRGPQPTEGTQRVWMSSQMLYGKRHCNVQQVLPKSRFPALTVLHLPNKNYRRVGKYRNRKFADGSEVFETPHESLLRAMEVHIAIRQAFFTSTTPYGRIQQQQPYRGTRMVDDVGNGRRDRTPLLERRMREYQEYVDRGGVLSVQDMTKTALVEEQ